MPKLPAIAAEHSNQDAAQPFKIVLLCKPKRSADISHKLIHFHSNSSVNTSFTMKKQSVEQIQETQILSQSDVQKSPQWVHRRWFQCSPDSCPAKLPLRSTLLDTRTTPELFSAKLDPPNNLLPPTFNAGDALNPPTSPEVRPTDAAMQAEDITLLAMTRVLPITICSISIHQTEQ